MSKKATKAADRISEIQSEMNRGWNIPNNYLDEFPEELHRMVFGKHEDYETNLEEHDEPGQVRIQAIKLILEMKKQNIAEGLSGNGKAEGQADDEAETEIENRRSNIIRFIDGKSKESDDASGDRTTGSGNRTTTGRKTATRKPAKERIAKRKA